MCTLLQWNTFCLVETLWAIVNPEVNLDDNLTYCTFSFNVSITPSVMHKNEKRSLRCWLCSFSGCIILDTRGGKKLCPEYIGAVCQENPFSSFPICRTGTRWMLDKSVLRKHGLWIKLFQINHGLWFSTWVNSYTMIHENVSLETQAVLDLCYLLAVGEGAWCETYFAQQRRTIAQRSLKLEGQQACKFSMLNRSLIQTFMIF